MGYFSYIAEWSFGTSPTGERLFFLYGFLSRPFIIPDEETKQRLFRKRLWMVRIVSGLCTAEGLLLSFIFDFLPEVAKDSKLWSVVIFGLCFVMCAINYCVFYSEFKFMKRAELPVPIKAILGDKAKRNSVSRLALGILVYLFGVPVGMLILDPGDDFIFPLLVSGLSGVYGLVLGYVLYLKIQK